MGSWVLWRLALTGVVGMVGRGLWHSGICEAIWRRRDSHTKAPISLAQGQAHGQAHGQTHPASSGGACSAHTARPPV